MCLPSNSQGCPALMCAPDTASPTGVPTQPLPVRFESSRPITCHAVYSSLPSRMRCQILNCRTITLLPHPHKEQLSPVPAFPFFPVPYMETALIGKQIQLPKNSSNRLSFPPQSYLHFHVLHISPIPETKSISDPTKTIASQYFTDLVVEPGSR